MAPLNTISERAPIGISLSLMSVGLTLVAPSLKSQELDCSRLVHDTTTLEGAKKRAILIASPQRILDPSGAYITPRFRIDRAFNPGSELKLQFPLLEKCLAQADTFEIVTDTLVMTESGSIHTGGKDLIIRARKIEAAPGARISLYLSQSDPGAMDAVDYQKISTSVPLPIGVRVGDYPTAAAGADGPGGKHGGNSGNLELELGEHSTLPRIEGQGQGGGDGVAGTQGADGTDGASGQNFLIAGGEARRLTIIRDRGNLIDLKLDNQKFTSELKKTAKDAEINGARGIRGGQGGTGGPGGNGGSGGNIRFITHLPLVPEHLQQALTQASALEGGSAGRAGSTGSSGKSGKGGQPAYRITAEKRPPWNAPIVRVCQKGVAGMDAPLAEPPARANRVALPGRQGSIIPIGTQSGEVFQGILSYDWAKAHVLAIANHLFQEGEAAATARAAQLYLAILQSNSSLPLPQLVSQTLRGLQKAAENPSNLNESSRLLIETSMSAIESEAFYRLSLVRAGLNFYGRSYDWVTPIQFDDLVRQTEELLPVYEQLHAARLQLEQGNRAAWLAALDAQTEAGLQSKFGLEQLKAAIKAADNQIVVQASSLERQLLDHKAKQQLLESQKLSRELLKSIPLVATQDDSFEQFLGITALLAETAATAETPMGPASAFRTASALFGLGNSQQEQQRRRERDNVELQIRELQVDTEIKNLLLTLQQAENLIDEALLHLKNAMLERESLGSKMEELKARIEHGELRASLLRGNTADPSVFDEAYGIHRRLVSERLAEARTALEFKWKIKLPSDWSARQVSESLPHQLRTQLSLLKAKDQETAKERGRFHLNPSDPASRSFDHSFKAIEISSETHPLLFESFRQSGRVDLTLRYDAVEANSPFNFDSRMRVPEIETVGILFANNESDPTCLARPEIDFEVTHGSEEVSSMFRSPELIRFNISKLSLSRLVHGLDGLSLPAVGSASYHQLSQAFLETHLLNASGANRDHFVHLSPVSNWTFSLKNPADSACIRELKFIVLYRGIWESR